jgi:hypothetical protein
MSLAFLDTFDGRHAEAALPRQHARRRVEAHDRGAPGRKRFRDREGDPIGVLPRSASR